MIFSCSICRLGLFSRAISMHWSRVRSLGDVVPFPGRALALTVSAPAVCSDGEPGNRLSTEPAGTEKNAVITAIAIMAVIFRPRAPSKKAGIRCKIRQVIFVLLYD